MSARGLAWAMAPSLLVLLAGCGPKAGGGDTLPAGFAIKAKAIELPADRVQLPASAVALTQNCTGCHSAEQLLTQPHLDAKTWGAEIDKMGKVYHAPIDPADDARLLAELEQLQGAPKDAPHR